MPLCDVAAPFTSVQPVAELNTTFLDGGGRFTSNELTAVFHSGRLGGTATRFFIATRPSRQVAFSPPTLLFSEGTGPTWPNLTEDGLTLVYNENTDVYVSTRLSTSDPFPAGTLLTGVSSAAMGESSVFLPASAKTLYFTRYDPEGAVYDAPWPQADSIDYLKPPIETGAEEATPALTPDELVIYFRRNTGTGADIWVATRADRANDFDPPTLVAELQTAGAESPTWISPDRCRLYFESDRSGNYDVWVAERTPP